MDRDDIIVQLTNIGWQEEDIIKVKIFIFCFDFCLRHTGKKGTNSKRKPRQKLSALGPNFPIDMTWEHLFLLNLSKE